MSPVVTKSLLIEHVHIESLCPDPANPRRISDAELEALTRSVREYGFVAPVIARCEDRTVIAGHQRLIAARKLGLKEVPVIFLDLTQEQARLLNVALNKISGSFDQELLARLLADLQAVPEVDLTLTGFDGDEIAKLLRSLDIRDKHDRIETFDVEAALAQPPPTRTTLHDLWHLGPHRVLCGDSTDPGHVARLLGDTQPTLMATDPPYLVNYQGGHHPQSHHNHPSTKDKSWDTYEDPEASVEFYVKFLSAALAHLADHVAVYQWHASKRQALVEQAWTQAGLLVHQQIVWAKARGVLTHSHYLWSHEPCFYGWVEGQPPTKKPPSGERTVWEIDQRGENLGAHPTQKPTELFMRPIEYHTEPGDVVYEPFLGSGTQVIAAERSARVCYAIEQEPQYVDVAIARWESFTGEQAVKEEGGSR